MKKIIVIGGGFGGLWSALSAMRLCKALGKTDDVEILLVNKDNYHGLRPRYYEQALAATQIPIREVLASTGIKFLVGEVLDIAFDRQKITVQVSSSEHQIHEYDRLVLAAGSQLYCPPIPGLQENSFNIDTYASAEKLAQHLITLPEKTARGRYTAVVVGGGFTGLEVATELPVRLQNIAQQAGHDVQNIRVIIIDRGDVGSALGEKPKDIIQQTLNDLSIETISTQQVSTIENDKIILTSGVTIDTQTVIWTAGMRANPLTAVFPVSLDPLGRLPVDGYLRIEGVRHCFAAGDVAHALTDDQHVAMMSCQHAMPQGRIAGYNVVADLFHQPLIAYRQEMYRTCLDLGSWGALYTEGWDRQVKTWGAAAKKTKLYINHQRICPPLTGNIDDLMNAAAPEIQSMVT